MHGQHSQEQAVTDTDVNQVITSNNLATLNHLAPGERATVKSILNINRQLARRLLSMGIVAGTAVEMICQAPLGDPIQIKALNYKLSLRRSEAQHIVVDVSSTK